jgi:hypothetical protein
MKSSELSKICEQQLLLLGDPELVFVGSRGWGSVRNEVQERCCFFTSLARGFECDFEGGIGDYVVDSHYDGSWTSGRRSCGEKVEVQLVPKIIGGT